MIASIIGNLVRILSMWQTAVQASVEDFSALYCWNAVRLLATCYAIQ